MPRMLHVERFEFTRDRRDGAVAFSFIGRTLVPDGSRGMLKGQDFVVSCGSTELVFSDVTPENLEFLAAAPAIYVLRNFANQFEMSQVFKT